jgi:hypothetical protein
MTVVIGTVVSTGRYGSSGDGTDRLERLVLLQATHSAMLGEPDGTDPPAVDTDPRAGGTSSHYN